jgi:hypothetical protein
MQPLLHLPTILGDYGLQRKKDITPHIFHWQLWVFKTKHEDNQELIWNKSL